MLRLFVCKRQALAIPVRTKPVIVGHQSSDHHFHSQSRLYHRTILQHFDTPYRTRLTAIISAFDIPSKKLSWQQTPNTSPLRSATLSKSPATRNPLLRINRTTRQPFWALPGPRTTTFLMTSRYDSNKQDIHNRTTCLHCPVWWRRVRGNARYPHAVYSQSLRHSVRENSSSFS